jgi:hypothetical protein
MSETEELAVATEVPPPCSTASQDGGGTEVLEPPSKPRSGFGRMKIKVARLTELYENMRSDYETLLADHFALRQSHEKLEGDYTTLESAFSEIAHLNATLAGELRQLKQQRPASVRYGVGLMGM